MDALLIENEVSVKQKRTKIMQGNTIVEKKNFVNNESLKRKLIKDIGEKAFSYFQSIPFIFNLKVLYFSPTRHYFYQPAEFSNLDAIINLRPINSIKDLEGYMRNINQLLPEAGYYVGSYKDYKYEMKSKSFHFGLKYFLMFLHRLNNTLSNISGLRNFYFFIKSDYSQPLTLKDVRKYFQRFGFSVANIHHIEGFTYFLLIKMDSGIESQSWYESSDKSKKAMIIEL